MEGIILVGCGYMGEEYIKSLIKLGKEFTVIGNTEKKCKKIREKYSINIISGGLEDYKFNIIPKYIIITSPIQLLEKHLEIGLDTGCKNILIEKPGGLDLIKMEKICDKYNDRNIIVGYNRRFYRGVQKAKEIIEEDDGVLSFNLNITELIHLIDDNKYDNDVLDK